MKSFVKKSTWFQLLFWGIIWVLVPLILLGGEHPERAILRSLKIFIAVFAVVFINLELLLPKLYFQKQIINYTLASIGLILVIYFLLDWEGMPWSEFFHPNQKRALRKLKRAPYYAHFFRFFGSITPYLVSLIGSSLFAIANFAASKEKETALLKSEKLEAEMKFLKSQINPHFLFNALNNVYTLSVIKSDDAPDNLLKLSGMLRYMLYDCKADRVPLRKELDYIDNFVDLHRLKDSKGLNIKLNLDRSQPELLVAPLIFVPFIENAFKHSKIEDLENGWIEINLATGTHEILFEVKNSIPEVKHTKDQVGGIGLKNVKRQLELVYPGQHNLEIKQTENEFRINLKIHVL